VREKRKEYDIKRVKGYKSKKVKEDKAGLNKIPGILSIFF
jgi:hypothetical protein